MHLLSQLDPMVWLMMVVVAIAFVVSAAVLVELLPGAGRSESEGAGKTGVETPPAAAADPLASQPAPSGNQAPVA